MPLHSFVKTAMLVALLTSGLAAHAEEPSVLETIIATLRSRCLNDFDGLQNEDSGFARIAVDPAMLPMVCACAEKGMRGDPWLDRIAQMPASERNERSKAIYLRQSYIVHGLECLPRSRPQLDAAQDGVQVRSLESVRDVFQRRAPQFHAAYQRALIRHPGLSGKVILSVTIDPSGKVANVVAQQRSLGDAQLEQELLDLVRETNFGAMEVKAMMLTWPIEFIPE